MGEGGWTSSRAGEPCLPPIDAHVEHEHLRWYHASMGYQFRFSRTGVLVAMAV